MAKIRHITLVDMSGENAPVLLYQSKRKKKRKVSKWLKPFEKMDRRLAEASHTHSAEVLRGHKRSNRKRKNGWLRDRTKNSMRAKRKAFKKLRK